MKACSTWPRTPLMVLLWGLMLLVTTSAGAGGKESLRVGRLETLPALGIKFRGLKDAKPTPLQAVTTQTLMRGDGVEIEAYSLHELWYHEQCLGRWGNNLGTLTLAHMTLPPPGDEVKVLFQADDGDSLVKQEAYEKWQKRAEATVAPEQMHQWLQFFAKAKLTPEPETIKKGGPVKSTTLLYRSAEGEPQTCWAYVVSPVSAPQTQLVFIYQIKPRADSEKSGRAILQSLASLVFYQPARDEDKTAVEKVTKQVGKRDESPEYTASCETVIKNIENLKGWWYLKTDSFILASNLKNRKTIQVIEENLESSRGAFVDFYPVKAPLKAVSVCRVFQERDEYLTYVGPEYQWSGGLWASSRKELVVSPAGWGSTRDQRKMIVDVVYHEGFHQYIYYATAEVQNEIWFNEGNATFFEGIDFKSKGKYEILATERAELIQQLAAGGPLPAAAMLKMSHQEFVGRAREQNYAMAWAVIYFLRKGCQVIEKEEVYGAILSRYYDAVIESGDSEQATKLAWAGVDRTQFEADFNAFWSSPNEVKRAGRVEPIKYLPASTAPQASPAPGAKS